MKEKCFKGFYPGMICKGSNNGIKYERKYSEGETAEEGNAEICKKGIHYCKNPFDVLKYYDLVNSDGNINEFAEVEPLEEELTNDNEKFCSKKVKIGFKLGLKGFVKACIDFTFESCMKESEDYAQLASSGYSAQLASSGDYAKLASSGDSSQLASSGDYAKLASSGDSSQLASSGENSIVCGIGYNNIAKGIIGNWIVLAEWEKNIPVCVKVGIIDGVNLKEDVFYKLEKGEFIEC